MKNGKTKRVASKKKTPRKPAPKVPVSPEAFVKTWQACKSAAETRAKLGVHASNRAATYRRKGVPLKRFTPIGGRVVDYKALAALVKKAS